MIEKKFGNKNTFSPLIEVSKQLLKASFYITISGKEVSLSYLLLTSDNKGLHKLQRFVEIFFANFSCRICKMTKKLLQTSRELRQTIVRTIDDYNADLLINNVSLTGVNDECVFNEIFTLDYILNALVDIMHDIYKGICKYVMSTL